MNDEPESDLPEPECSMCGDTGLLDFHGYLVPCSCAAGKYYLENPKE